MTAERLVDIERYNILYIQCIYIGVFVLYNNRIVWLDFVLALRKH